MLFGYEYKRSYLTTQIFTEKNLCLLKFGVVGGLGQL
jgi:hypothetical protein